jgi:hypothetical protein
MEEEVTQRTIALSVKAGKLTTRTLAKVFAAALRQMQKTHRARLTPHGRQSVRKLMNHGVSTSSLPLDAETRLFDRVARKYNVDYAFHKTGPGKYLLFFKAGQADAITAAFSEYTKLVMRRARGSRPSILAQLRKFGDMVRSRPRVHERKREATRDER